MSKITDWFKSNKLHHNINKSIAILFYTYHETTITCNDMIRINDKIVHFFKLFSNICPQKLGIYIDKNLTRNVHLKHISIKISKSVGVLSHL